MVVAAIKVITHEKTILFGAYGMLGHALQEVFPHAQCYGHRSIDITDENALMKLLKTGVSDDCHQCSGIYRC